MAKRKPKPVPAAKPRVAPHVLRMGLRLLLALAAVFGLLLGLGYLGEYAGSRVAGDPRYLVPFADIRCDVPPYIDRTAFLAEVRIRSQLPEKISAVDPATPGKLQEAFRKHPWVAEAKAVTVTKEGTLRVELVFRTPVLAIRTQGVLEPQAVDAGGVLLPDSAPLGGLPVLLNTMPKTETKPGEKHADPDVVRAAELVAVHPARSIERTREGWRIIDAAGKVLRIAVN
jgi:hypothetical protein